MQQSACADVGIAGPGFPGTWPLDHDRKGGWLTAAAPSHVQHAPALRHRIDYAGVPGDVKTIQQTTGVFGSSEGFPHTAAEGGDLGPVDVFRY